MMQSSSKLTTNTMVTSPSSSESAPLEKAKNLKHIVQEDLQRKYHQGVAIKSMVEEQKSRINRQTMDLVVNDLVRQVSRQVTSKAILDEQQQQALMHFRHQLCDDIRRAVGQRYSISAMHKEQSLRSTVDPSTITIHDSKVPINEAISRRGNQLEAIHAMEIEQRSRTVQHHMKSVCEDIVRAVNRKHATVASNNEQVERITRDLVKDVCEELRRTSARKDVLSALDTEQQLRITTPAPSNTDAEMDAKQELVQALGRMGNQTEALELMELERAARICRANVHAFCEDVRRTVGRRRVSLDVDEEQVRQTVLHRHRHAICEDLRSATSRKQAARLAEDERQLRANPDVNYWVKDSSRISDAKHAINADIVMMGNTMEAQQTTEFEQHQRITQQSMAHVCEELVRVVNRNLANQAIDLEQAQRVCRDRTHQLCEELRRVAARNVAVRLADDEQQLRTSQQPPQHTTEQRDQVLQQVQRVGDQKFAITSMNREQEHRLHELRMHGVCEQIQRSVNASIANTLMMTEQSQRVCRDIMHQVCDDVRRTVNRLSATQATEVERQRQSTSTPPDMTETRRQLLHAIERRGAKLNAIVQMELERDTRIHADQMHEVCDSLRRHVGKQTALDSMKEVQQECVAKRQLFIAADQLVQIQKRKTATIQSDRERHRLLAEPMTPTKELKALHRRLSLDIIANTVAPCA
eukprot:m.196936 g.196936  ORF g.196936 m.196936 type:complete len:697 (+) comp32638_c0_seq1:314-2404(+)